MSEVSRVRKDVACHVQRTLDVSATARRRRTMLDVGLGGLHIVTLARAPCERVHHSQSDCVRVQRLRAHLGGEEGRGCGRTEA